MLVGRDYGKYNFVKQSINKCILLVGIEIYISLLQILNCWDIKHNLSEVD